MSLDPYLAKDIDATFRRHWPTGNSDMLYELVDGPLYQRVAAGEADAVKQMIEIHLPLVVNKVASYIRCYPNVTYLQDELLSEGLLGLTRAVNKMAEDGPISDPKPTGYIEHWIFYYIGMVADREDATSESDRTKRRRRQRDETATSEGSEKHLHRIPITDSIVEHMNNNESADPTSMCDLRDLIYACCDTEADRIIVDMRERGYKDKEIAAVIDMPVTSTYMLRRAIYGRFLAKSGLAGEM